MRFPMHFFTQACFARTPELLMFIVMSATVVGCANQAPKTDPGGGDSR